MTSHWSDSITIAWDAPASDGGKPVTSYIVERRDAKRSNWVKIGTTDAEQLSFKAANLFEGSSYYFRLVFDASRKWCIIFQLSAALFRVFAENSIGVSEPIETTQSQKAQLPYGSQTTPFLQDKYQLNVYLLQERLSLPATSATSTTISTT